ncbi:protein CIP2A homolog [Actinia tenebrosa]|uniref:Protein CIP2A homolog n=1 Tax=Actinia tenebrosa TaxID=6105 RepID=A0A6P8H786_ACTTE|nr:protein CIP2A homolog [Actinia tenebrosa]
MALDVTVCLKGLSSAFCQYRFHTTEQTVKDLERQVDVLIGVSSSSSALQGFCAKDLLPAECLSSLVGLLNEKTIRPNLHMKAMILLFNLASDNETREILHSTYHLTSTLAAFLHRHQVTCNEKFVLQCLQLLQRITYCCRITTTGGYLEELIRFLVKHIQMPESEFTVPCLGLLANLCRHNLSVQAHIKAMEQIKSLYRTLISFLSHGNLTVIIFSLSILTSLCLNEQLGEKLFNSKNIHQTFQLIFNILFNGEGSLTRKYSVDLFVDLLESSKIQQSLVVHEHLSFYLEQILNLFSSTAAEEAAKIFELLLTFCSVNGVRTMLCKTFLCSEVTKAKGEDKMNEMYNSVVYWASQPVESHPSVSLYALDFLKEMYEVRLYVLICCESSLKKSVLKHMKLDQCWKVIEYQYQHNNMSTRNAAATCWGEEGVEVVLKMLSLLCSLKDAVPEIKQGLPAALQDQRLIPLLAHGLSSSTRSNVQKALKILSDAAALTDFQMIWLGEVMASNNSARKDELSSLRKPAENGFSPPSSPSRSSTNHIQITGNGLRGPVAMDTSSKKSLVMSNRTNINEANIESLIERMKSGLEIKDPKASEIMDIYEAKLAALLTKESHLQDLLEAKALAVDQADRLISQYRCRRAQSEAECTKLRQILQDAEKKNEKQTEQINMMLEAQKMASKEMETLMRYNENLKIIEEEHEHLKVAFAEQSQRLETNQRSLMAAQDENKALTELSEMLRRHNDNLKSQHDCATKQLLELEQERKNVVQQLKERETKVQETKKALQQQEKKTCLRESEIEELKSSIEKLKEDLIKNEQIRKDLMHKVSSLEVLCRQHEEVIKERENSVNTLQNELDRQSQIAAMIHKLTSEQTANNKSTTSK